MEDYIVYIADLPYKVDFDKKSLTRLDNPDQVLYADKLTDEGHCYTTRLYKDTRLPQVELLETSESQRLAFDVVIPTAIFDKRFWNDPKEVAIMNFASERGKWHIHLGHVRNPAKFAPDTSRALPEFEIAGTTFLVDVEKLELREKYDFKNTIPILQAMRETENGYQFLYHLPSRNVPNFLERVQGNADFIEVTLPPLVSIDPEGMSKKYGLTVAEIKDKSDFEVMVDQQALYERLNGRLTTIDIAGHIFYVDHRLEKLRPKDDFGSKGITFDELDDYISDEGTFLIPYNPDTRQLQPIGNDIVALPSDVVLVEIPSPYVMDRLGFNRKIGADLQANLKETGVRLHYLAKQLEWKEVGLDKLIQDNIKKHIKEVITPEAKKANAQRKTANNKIRKGRKL
ncbi:hypothetical protein [uncultured Pedobacter sp.]|uniref:hypothetical protein n=1 Tax=uncultured Pedobacter sp. TaxID=246139 RepID=UPI00260C2DF5|nr:hypothetical protein [uncultured Pedobacter sp.]